MSFPPYVLPPNYASVKHVSGFGNVKATITVFPIANSAISTNKIADAAVVGSKIADSAVVGSKIADNVGTKRLPEVLYSPTMYISAGTKIPSASMGTLPLFKVSVGDVISSNIDMYRINIFDSSFASIGQEGFLGGTSHTVISENAAYAGLSVSTGNIFTIKNIQKR